MDYNSRILARNYAKAFCNTSFFSAPLQDYEQLVIFHKDLLTNKALILMMSSSLLDKVTKQHYCLWLLKRYKLEHVLLPLIELLVVHERIILLVLVVQMCLQLYENHHCLERFEISSATELNENILSVVENYLSSTLHKKIISKTIVDSVGLIAGIKIKSMTHCLDHSLAKKLRSVRHMLVSQGITWK